MPYMNETPNKLLNPSEEIEVELIKIIKYLIKEWKIIILSVLIFFIIGIYNFSQKDTFYETSVFLETGTYSESPAKIFNFFGDDEIIRNLKVFIMKRSDQNIPDTEFSVVSKKLIKIKLNSNSIKNNLNLLNTLILNMTDEEQKTFNSIQVDHLDNISSEVNKLSTLIEIQNEDLELMNQWGKISNSIELKSILRTSQSRIRKEIIILEDQIRQLNDSKNYQLNKTQIVKDPESNLIKTNLLLVVFSSIIIGFFAALTFLALKHFINTYKGN
jgi:hypothetical protein